MKKKTVFFVECFIDGEWLILYPEFANIMPAFSTIGLAREFRYRCLQTLNDPDVYRIVKQTIIEEIV